MHDFTPSEHPRAQTGRFAEKAHTGPELAPLTAEVDPQAFRDDALDASTSSERISELVGFDNWMLDAWISRHPNLSAADQATLFERGDFQVRSRLAGSPAATAATLRLAANDDNRDVRATAAMHLNLSDEDQLLLAGDIRPLVQGTLIQAAGAGGRELTGASRDALATSSDPWVLEQLSLHDSATSVLSFSQVERQLDAVDEAQ
jgi:hypothetical protein